MTAHVPMYIVIDGVEKRSVPKQAEVVRQTTPLQNSVEGAQWLVETAGSGVSSAGGGRHWCNFAGLGRVTVRCWDAAQEQPKEPPFLQ